jgi:methylenetetrahydrofolate dehydrogenase (NADP+)/methenyltetrahydrofolate cyclohydrolase
MIIDGKTIAADLVAALKPKIAALAPKRFLGAALVGEDEISRKFLAQKKKVADELGIDFRLYEIPATVTTDDLRKKIGDLAGSKTCGGFIVQLPLPEQLENAHYVLNAIPKWKDVDCLSEAALGAFYTGRHPVVPPAVAVVEELLGQVKHADLRDLTVAVIGAGILIGRPIAFWFQNRVAELMVFDSKSKNLHERLAEADVVISGAGKPGLFSAKHLRKGAIILDFGYGKAPSGKLAGDLDPADAEKKDITYTKTPGGTGPVLVAKLYENFWKLATTKN